MLLDWDGLVDESLVDFGCVLGVWLDLVMGGDVLKFGFIFDIVEDFVFQFQLFGWIGLDENLFWVIIDSVEGQVQVFQECYGVIQCEVEVLIWIVKGKVNKDIGEILNFSFRMVNKYLEQVFVKLGVENRVVVVVWVVEVIYVF